VSEAKIASLSEERKDKSEELMTKIVFDKPIFHELKKQFV